MSSVGKKKKGPALMTKVLKKKKLRKAKKKVPPVPLIPGTKIVVETLSTNTKANVVWQDGSVEFGINIHMIDIHYIIIFVKERVACHKYIYTKYLCLNM